MRYKNILFDLDGTLTDSGKGILNSASYAFRQLGLPLPPQQELKKMIGPPLSQSFAFLGVPTDQVEEAVRLYRDWYNNHGGKYENEVYPGIEKLLLKLQKNGCKLYVATSKPEVVARDILAKFKLDSYFEYIAGATFDHSRESKTDVLRYLLKLIGENKDTVMIGDTHYDVIGAKEVGLPCIGVSWGYGTVESMQAAGVFKIADSPEDLYEYL